MKYIASVFITNTFNYYTSRLFVAYLSFFFILYVQSSFFSSKINIIKFQCWTFVRLIHQCLHLSYNLSCVLRDSFFLNFVLDCQSMFLNFSNSYEELILVIVRAWLLHPSVIFSLPTLQMSFCLASLSWFSLVIVTKLKTFSKSFLYIL